MSEQKRSPSQKIAMETVRRNATALSKKMRVHEVRERAETAIRKNDLERLKACVDEGLCFDGDHEDENGEDFLTQAAGRASSLDCLRWVAQTADLGKTNEMGLTALVHAVNSGNTEGVGVLLSARAARGETVDMQEQKALRVSVLRGDQASTLVLLPFFDAKSEEWELGPLLMLAAKKGHAETVRALLPMCDPREKSSAGETALMAAASGMGPDCAECVKLLIPVSETNAATSQGETALMRAAQDTRPDNLRQLLPHCDPNMVSSALGTALHVCVGLDNEESARVLAPFSDLSIRHDGLTAMELAVEKRHWGCVDALGEHMGEEEAEAVVASVVRQLLPRTGARAESGMLKRLMREAGDLARAEPDRDNRDTLKNDVLPSTAKTRKRAL